MPFKCQNSIANGRVAVRTFTLSKRLALEFQPIGVVNQPVQNGVGDGGIVDQFVPLAHWKLASDQRGALPVT